MNPSVVVVGSINADLVLQVKRHPRPGETVPGQGGQLSCGGKGANQAVAAARLGASVAMIGAVGTDAAADAAMAVLRETAIDLSLVSTIDGPTGLAIVVVDERGENCIIVVPGANDALDAKHIRDVGELLEQAAVVVSQGEIPSEGIDAAARLCTGRFLLNLAPVIPVAQETLMRSDPLLVNEHEGRLAAIAMGVDEPLSDEDREVVSILRELGVRSVVMTCGARGAIVAEGAVIHEIPSPRVHVVDTTGAGDAFAGALAMRLSESASLSEAAQMAVKAGAFACTAPGTQTSYARKGDRLPA